MKKEAHETSAVEDKTEPQESTAFISKPTSKSKLNIVWVMGGTIVVQLLIIIALVVFIALGQTRRPMVFQGEPIRRGMNGNSGFTKDTLEIKP
jgi:hypothetical protein